MIRDPSVSSIASLLCDNGCWANPQRPLSQPSAAPNKPLAHPSFFGDKERSKEIREWVRRKNVRGPSVPAFGCAHSFSLRLRSTSTSISTFLWTSHYQFLVHPLVALSREREMKEWIREWVFEEVRVILFLFYIHSLSVTWPSTLTFLRLAKRQRMDEREWLCGSRTAKARKLSYGLYPVGPYISKNKKNKKRSETNRW